MNMIKVECNKGHYCKKMWKVGDKKQVKSLEEIDKSTRDFWTVVKEFSHKAPEATRPAPVALSQIASDITDEEEGISVSKDKDTPPEYLGMYDAFEKISAPYDKRWGIKRLNKEYKKAVKKIEGEASGGSDAE